jgi:hypothetical protein
MFLIAATSAHNNTLTLAAINIKTDRQTHV